MNRRIVAAVLAVLMAGIAYGGSEDWQELFDGKTLDGWIQKNGTAKYTVEDGAIMGTTTKGSPNSFLCTKKEYGDAVSMSGKRIDLPHRSCYQCRDEVFQLCS